MISKAPKAYLPSVSQASSISTLILQVLKVLIVHTNLMLGVASSHGQKPPKRTMSIASSPNAFAVTAICDLVYSNSCLEVVRMIDVSAQSVASQQRKDGSFVRCAQSSAANWLVSLSKGGSHKTRQDTNQ